VEFGELMGAVWQLCGWLPLNSCEVQTKKDITINQSSCWEFNQIIYFAWVSKIILHKAIMREIWKDNTEKGPTVVLNKELNGTSYQVLYPVCPTGSIISRLFYRQYYILFVLQAVLYPVCSTGSIISCLFYRQYYILFVLQAVLYPVCPTGSNRLWICPCLPPHILHSSSPLICPCLPPHMLHGTSPLIWSIAPISLLCSMYKWHHLSDYHFLQSHRLGHLLF
jgi:hypothetical protein